MTKVYIETYGCTLNQADSDIMKALLKEKGYTIVETEEESDAVVLNTCTVKGATESKIMSKIKVLTDQKKKLVVAGCLTVNEERIRKIAPQISIVGTASLKSIDAAVEAALHDIPKTYRTFESKDGLPKVITIPIMRIPINDGCTSSCNFCQTKLARPFLRSYSPKTIVTWINESVTKGAREIQLTSMDSGAYGIDIKTNLITLLKNIREDTSANKTTDTFFVRLGMINPNHAKRMLPELIHLLKHEKFYKFIHIPVQAGSERVCREMNRDHGVTEFIEIVTTLRKEIPDICISTDIIVGYPTETNEDYEETKTLLNELNPDITNVSKFSPGPGTTAKKLKQLPSEEVKRRSKELSFLVKKISEEVNKKLIGKTYTVLITEKDKHFKGRNEFYKQIVVPDFKGKLGEWVKVKIYDANYGSLFGRLA